VKYSACKQRKIESDIKRDEVSDVDQHLMSKLREELTRYLRERADRDATNQDRSKRECFRVMAYLYTLTLLLIPPPRSQVMRLLKIDESLTWSDKDSRFVIEVAGRLLKNKQTYFARIPDLLTDFYHMYIDIYRPVLVDGSGSLSVWVCCRSGGQRADMAELTRLATQECIGVEMTPHQFRSAIISLIAAGSDGDDQTMENLAKSMTHSREVQRLHYVRVSRERVAKSVEKAVDRATRKRKRSISIDLNTCA
jgi:hypothetical protein